MFQRGNEPVTTEQLDSSERWGRVTEAADDSTETGVDFEVVVTEETGTRRGEHGGDSGSERRESRAVPRGSALAAGGSGELVLERS